MNELQNRRPCPAPDGRGVRLLGVVMVALLAGASFLEAGSVFMKNGYIIQGPLVERDDESVVLGWENGEVTIHWRFIDSVSYDPGEEARIEQREAARRAALARAEEDALRSYQEEELEDLPADFGMFLRMYGDEDLSPLARGGSPSETGSGNAVPTGTEPVETDSAATPEASRVPEDDLADETFRSASGLTLRAPRGWTTEEREEFLRVLGPDTGEGMVPGFNVTRVSRGELSAEECLELVKEEQRELLLGYEILHEGERRLGKEREFAHEVTGRGVFDGKVRVVRQMLVPLDDSVWLFSSFAEGVAPDDDVFALIEESLASVEFPTEEPVFSAPDSGAEAPASDAASEPEPSPATEPVAPPATEPVAPPATEPVAPPATEPSAPPATEPVAPPATEPGAPQAVEG